MIGICQDNSYLFRDALTIGKEYEIIESYNDPYAGYLMIKVKCDNGDINPYRANRFDIKNQVDIIDEMNN